MWDVVYPFGQALGMFAPSCVCVCVCERDVVYVGCCVPVWPGVGHVCSFMCVCVREMLCMWDVVYPFGQALGMFAPSCVCVCEGDVVYVGCCVPVWPGVGHVCSFMCVCV